MPTTRRLESLLAAYWKCDSLYGATVGADSIGANTLSSGSVGSTTGKVYEAALFTRASSNYLGIASNATLQSLKSFAFWVKFTTINNDMTLIHKGTTATAANSSVWIKYDTANNRLQYQVGDGAGNSATCSTSGLSFVAGTWYFVCARYDTAAGKLSLSVNGSVYGTTSTALAQFVETGTFYLGRSASGNYLDGALDEVCCSTSSLTLAEEMTLFNGGTGIQPPFLEGPIGSSSSSGRYPRRLPPSFAQTSNGKLFVAYGDECVKVWDGLATSFQCAGVPAPTTKPALASGGTGSILGTRYAYYRFLDASGRPSNLSPLSDPANVWGSTNGITDASNTAPIIITSASHGLSAGDIVRIDGVQGNKAANGTWTVTIVDADRFALNTSAGSGDFLGVNAGSVSVMTVRDGAAAVDEVQTISATAVPSGGTWTISFDGFTTSALAATANAAAVQSALEALFPIGSGNVVVTGGPLGTATFNVTFQGTAGGINQPAITVDAASLLGATVTTSVETLSTGSPIQSEVQQFQLYGTPSGGTFTLSLDGVTSAPIAYNAANATIDSALEAMANIGVGQVTISGGPLPGSAVTVTFGGTLANTSVSELTINGTSLTGGGISVAISTPTQGVAGTTITETYDVGDGVFPWICPSGVTSVTCKAWGGGAAGSPGYTGTLTGGRGGPGGYFATTSSAPVTPGTEYQVVVGRGGTPTQDAGYSQFLGTIAPGGRGGTESGDTVYAGGSGGQPYSWTGSGGGGGSSAGTSAVGTNGYGGYSWDGGIAPAGGGNGGDGGRDGENGSSGHHPGGGGGGGGANSSQSGLGGNGADGKVELSYVIPSGGTNEVQRITVSGSPAQGNFTLTFGASTSGPIPYNASAGTLQAALEAMQTIRTGQVSCSGGPLPGTPVDVQFTGTLASTNVATMTANANNLTTSITTTTQGNPGTNEVQRLSSNVTPISGTFTVTFSGNTTSSQAHSVSAATLQSALEGLASIGSGNIAVTGGPLSSGSPFICTFQGTLANANQAAMTTASSMLGDVPTLSVSTSTEGVPGVNEQQQVYVAGDLTGGTYSLNTGSSLSAAQAYNGNASDLDTALEAIWGAGNIVTSGGPLPTPITVEWQGAHAATDIPEMTVNNSTTSGGWARGAQYLVYTNIEIPTDRRVVKRQILRNKAETGATFYVDVEDTDLTATSFTSYNTDSMLGEAVDLLTTNGYDLNVVRHGEPPDSKRAIASFLNRLFAAVNHVSTDGELTATNGSGSITGQNAFFRDVYDNRSVFPQGASNTRRYDIDTLNVSDQTITSTTTYDGTTSNGIHYGIETAPPDDLTLYFSELDDVESWNSLNGLTIERVERDGRMTGLCPLVTSMLILFEARTYKLTFRASPLLSSNPEFGGDGRVIPASWRGCVNNRCAAKAGALVYLLDNQGIWTYDDNNTEDITDPITPMFQPGHQWSIYWPAKESFHAVYDPENSVVKWFVVIGDGMYPKHAICWDVGRKRFWIEEYPWPITSSTTGKIGHRTVVFYGSTARRLFVATEDLDLVNVRNCKHFTLRGTPTSANQYTLTDSAATFPDALTNVPVVIVSGKGARQRNVIVSNTSTTLTLLNPWIIAPDSTSVYQIGGIHWTWKSAMMKLTQKGSEDLRGVSVTYLPTTRDSTIVLRKYADFNADADLFAADYDSDGTSTTDGSEEVLLDLTHSTGFVEVAADSFFTGRGTHQRYATIELTGTTNGERQTINEISIIGVES